MNKDIRYKIEGVSRNVVNQLYDLAEVPVKKRQSINDTADEFVIKLISQLFRSTLKESLEDIFSRLPTKADPMSRDEILEQIEKVGEELNNNAI